MFVSVSQNTGDMHYDPVHGIDTPKEVRF